MAFPRLFLASRSWPWLQTPPLSSGMQPVSQRRAALECNLREFVRRAVPDGLYPILLSLLPLHSRVSIHSGTPTTRNATLSISGSSPPSPPTTTAAAAIHAFYFHESSNLPHSHIPTSESQPPPPLKTCIRHKTSARPPGQDIKDRSTDDHCSGTSCADGSKHL